LESTERFLAALRRESEGHAVVSKKKNEGDLKN
jgi:hypothetical protein